MKHLFQLFILFSLFQACSSSEDKKQSNFNVVRSPLEIHLINESSGFKLGDSVFFEINSATDTLKISSIDVFVGDSFLNQFDKLPIKASFSTANLNLGKHKIKASAKSGSSVQSKSSSITIYATNEPKKYSYKVINSFIHDKKAYTQGLAFLNGFIYEGTGQKGLSTVRKVDLSTGKVLEQIKNADNIFGEGIAILDNKIYQLSWISNVGFIYDLNSFELLNKFYYEGEGWGLTSNGSVLYRTDGSNKLYIHDKESFEVIDVLEVYSDKKAISNLNELEYIDGRVYANIWQEDNIAIINPKNGVLEGILSLKNILPPNERNSHTDVLNGIAYDGIGKRLFVTGKNWPRLFQIELKEVASN